jgi:hypothetical protein
MHGRCGARYDGGSHQSEFCLQNSKYLFLVRCPVRGRDVKNYRRFTSYGGCEDHYN